MHSIQLREETLKHTRITIGNSHYYFPQNISLESIADSTASKEELTILADVVYDYKSGKFIKCRWMDIKYLNGEL